MASPSNPNTFTDNPLDRASHLRADTRWLADARRHPDTRFVPLWQLKPLVTAAPGAGEPCEIGWIGASQLQGVNLGDSVFLGLEDGRPHFAVDVETPPDGGMPGAFHPTGHPSGHTRGTFEELLTVINRLAPRDASLLAQAKSMIDWHRRHGFCAQCGTPTEFADAGYRRDCPACKAQHFPRTDPVVISLVIRNDKCLLGRPARFNGPFFSALAGFLEPGETVEEAVAREVMEEVGIEVANVTYQSTQPWPYPSSLMIGCIADAVTDTITLDEKEIAEARWFNRDELRRGLADAGKINFQALMNGTAGGDAPEFVLPPASAIAHQLLRGWLEEQ